MLEFNRHPNRRRQCENCTDQGCPASEYLDSNNLICARTFLALANFKFDRLAIIECRVSATRLNFRMMNEQVFAAVLRGNKSKTFVGVEPLYCTFGHFLYS